MCYYALLHYPWSPLHCIVMVFSRHDIATTCEKNNERTYSHIVEYINILSLACSMCNNIMDYYTIRNTQRKRRLSLCVILMRSWQYCFRDMCSWYLIDFIFFLDGRLICRNTETHGHNYYIMYTQIRRTKTRNNNVISSFKLFKTE